MAVLIWIWHGGESTSPNARHEHAAHVAFEVSCGWGFRWALNEQEWLDGPGLDVSKTRVFRLQYGGEKRHPEADEFWSASGLLERQDLKWGREVESELLSFAFFMTSRLEEMEASDRHRDEHGRFLGGTSLAAMRGWLDRPEVDRRMQLWAERMQLPLGAARLSSEVIPTIDVDSAYAFRSKGWFRTAGAALKDVIASRPVWLRLRVAISGQADPYDTYEDIESLHAAFSLKTRYFFLLAARSQHDRGLPWRSRGLKKLIQHLSRTAEIGIHPGYQAHARGFKWIQNERDRLLNMLPDMDPAECHSRQHFLLQQPPRSWRDLVAAGITHDHSMAYADVTGFRAGVARPFRAFDLLSNEQMPLWLHPVAAMDATLLRYEKQTHEEAVERVTELAEAAAQVGGALELIWHNESVSDFGEWSQSGTFAFYTACLSAALKAVKRHSPSSFLGVSSAT